MPKLGLVSLGLYFNVAAVAVARGLKEVKEEEREEEEEGWGVVFPHGSHGSGQIKQGTILFSSQFFPSASVLNSLNCYSP